MQKRHASQCHGLQANQLGGAVTALQFHDFTSQLLGCALSRRYDTLVPMGLLLLMKTDVSNCLTPQSSLKGSLHAESGPLNGPPTKPGATDIVANQRPVDDLLDSLGF